MKLLSDDHIQMKKDIEALRRGNTALLEALMDMCDQYLSDLDGDVCHHGFMSAGEQALALLEKAGMASTSDGVTYELQYSALEKRKESE